MIGVICGMASEADCIARVPGGDRFEVRVSGASALRAGAHAADLAAQGARAIVSFGLSGALDPACPPGRLILPARTVLPGGGAIISDPELLELFSARALERQAELGGLPPLTAAIAGSEEVVDSRRAKRELHRRTGAVAVDMESHAVAHAARAAGIAYAAIRAVADPAHRSIPQTAMAGLAADGTTRPFLVIRNLMSRPQDLPALIRLGQDARTGLTTLRGAALHILAAL